MSLIWNSRRLLALVAALGLVALLAFSVACGDDDDDSSGDDTDATATAASTDGDGDDGGAETIDVTIADFSFTPSEDTVAAGSTVAFNLTNDGAALHNMRIAGADGEFETDDDAVSDPDTISGGETGTLDWTAPDEAGDILYRCDIHPSQMTGTITVE
jgi:plastocyanin